MELICAIFFFIYSEEKKKKKARERANRKFVKLIFTNGRLFK